MKRRITYHFPDKPESDNPLPISSTPSPKRKASRVNITSTKHPKGKGRQPK